MHGTVRPIGQQIVLTMLCAACPAPAAFAGKNRPQTPTPPFPYISKDVTFVSQNGTVTLAGTLTLPQTGGPFPAAYLIPGARSNGRPRSDGRHLAVYRVSAQGRRSQGSCRP